VVNGFKKAMEDAEFFQAMPMETILAYAKACVRLDDMEQAERILRKARSIAPEDRNLVFQLAKVLIARQQYEEAVAHLRYLTTFRSVRVTAYKLLGYACLFLPGGFEEAESATRKYLAIHPEDAGAKLNLACAIGQRGPQSPKRSEALNLLKEILEQYPGTAPLVASLTKGEQDRILPPGPRTPSLMKPSNPLSKLEANTARF
jgi:Flp pilus assembly protein TadD